jgi:DnaJ-class molecular chaperone
MGNKTLYEILEVNETASEEMIDNSYRFLVNKAKRALYESDFAEYENRLIVLRDSFNILSNKDKRLALAYDKSQSEKKLQHNIPRNLPKVWRNEKKIGTDRPL